MCAGAGTVTGTWNITVFVSTCILFSRLFQEFLNFLRWLLETDYPAAIHSGFEATGIHPLNLEKDLVKLPAEDKEVDSKVTWLQLNKLQEMRYSPTAYKHAGRPKNKEKLPAGASCT